MLTATLFYLYNALLSTTKPSFTSPSNSTILHFDDIPTTKGLGSVPSTYNHLSFSSYSALTPRDPALENWITPNDLNCAVSAPNALLGSRLGNGTAYFSVANATSMVEAGLQPYFSLISFNVKPMDAPPPGTTIFVKGYSGARNESNPFEWDVYFPAGYHLPFKVKIAEFSGEEWNELYGVEILADFGEQALDWEFCLDDLEIMFFQKVPDRGSPFVPNRKQNVLRDR